MEESRPEDSRGLSAKSKYLGQSLIGIIAAIVLYQIAKTPAETTLLVPFFKDLLIPLGLGYIILAYFVIVGTSNAVNLTDGLDGLAILPTVLVQVPWCFRLPNGECNFLSVSLHSLHTRNR